MDQNLKITPVPPLQTPTLPEVKMEMIPML